MQAYAHPLSAIFNPKAIAVVGASEVPGKAAERRTRSLLEGGYSGGVYLINPKRDRLFERKAYPSLEQIDGSIDLAMIVIPGRFIPQAVAQAAEKGAKGAVIITAGLGETGPEGKAIEAEIMDIADKTGINIIGPNCSGIYSAKGGMNLLGIPGLESGKLSVLAQSGNIIDSLSHFAHSRNRGFSRIISSGNAIGVRFHDYIEYLANDEATDVIMLYLESIKFGSEMVRVCRNAVKKKPIIALKVGRSTAGQRASASHTGALAADDAIVEDAFKQAGILRVNNVDEMFDLAECFLDSPVPKGNRVCILSEGGGDNSVAADNAERWGLEVPVLAKERQEKIKPHLLGGMPAHNPIDYGGTAEENPDVITKCVEQVMESKDVDSVYITGFFGGFKDIIASHVGELETKASQDMVELVKKYQKPIIVHTSFAKQDYDAINALKKGGIPVLESSDRAAACLAALAHQAANKAKPEALPKYGENSKAREVAQKIFAKVRKENRTSLLEPQANELLKAYGLEMLSYKLATTKQEAAQMAEELASYPLVAKVVSPAILHKSDSGGVKLNLENKEQVQKAFETIMENASKVTDKENVVGVMLCPMVGSGQECILGMINDVSFGPVLMFGMGGVYVEVLKDVSFGVTPVVEEDVDRMVKSIKSYALLEGVRGEKPKDVNAIKDLIHRISAMVLDNPELYELDLNPVIVHENGLSVVDARIILKD